MRRDEIAIEMALKASSVAGLFPLLRPTASSYPSTSNRPCSLRVLPLRPSFFGNSSFEMGWWRKKKKKPLSEKDIPKKTKPESDIASKRGAMLLEDLIECCDGKSNPIKIFSADEICKATDNFSDSNHISKLFQSEYKWYSVKTENHHKILIKILKFDAYRKGNFCRDIAVSSMVSGHKNFIKLIGCCLEFEDPVMVYQGVKKHYKLDIMEQTWKRRMKIAEDIATALAYLHTAFPRPFVYRSMGLGDIFLDEDGVAKLSDFSCCVLIPKGETFVQVDKIEGTYGYLDDKYLSSGVVSEETDVFAIGMIMQKLLTGLDRDYQGFHVLGKEHGEGDDDDDTNDYATMSKINDPKRQLQYMLLKFMEEGKMDEIADPEMVEKMGEISEEELCKMKAFGMLSLRCICRRGEVPTMVEVAKELKKIQRSLNNDSSSPSCETPFSTLPNTVVLSNNSLNTKALLT